MSEAVKQDLLMGSNLIEGKEYKDILISISEVVSEILTRTLGPYACTTTIDDGIFTYTTKDGYHSIESLRFGNNPIYMSLFNTFKNISFAINNKVGDGTTTVTVSANMFLKQLGEFLETHKAFRQENPNDLISGIIRQADLLNVLKTCKEEIISEIRSEMRTHKINKTENGYDEIYKIAHVASNRDDAISSMIKDIYDKTDNPNIFVTTAGTNIDTITEISKGYKLDAKMLLSECYINNLEDKTCELNTKVKIAIFDHNVKFNEHPDIINTIYNPQGEEAYTIIMAPYFDEAFMNIFATKIRGVANSGVMPSLILAQVPMVTNVGKNEVSDFAVITNAQLIDYGKVQMFNEIVKLEKDPEYTSDILKACLDAGYTNKFEIVKSCVGVTHHIVLGNKFAIIDNFDTTTSAYNQRRKIIEEEYATVRAEYEKTRNVGQAGYRDANLRYIKFLGNTGIIRVGGESDVEKKFMKDVIDDAVLACKAAFENGFIRGLNLETISAASELASRETVKFQKMVMEAKILVDEGNKITRKQRDDIMQQYIRLSCFNIITNTFFNVSLLVMKNKHIDDAEDYKWNISLSPAAKVIVDEYCKKNSEHSISWPYEFDNAEAENIIRLAISFGLGYDIVTETFEAPGENIINSVLTDCEILNAITTMLSLLLSSNQCVSMNQMFDKKSTRESLLKAQTENAKATAKGYAEAFRDAGLTLFADNLPTIESTLREFGSTYDDDDCEGDMRALKAIHDNREEYTKNISHDECECNKSDCE